MFPVETPIYRRDLAEGSGVVAGLGEASQIQLTTISISGTPRRFRSTRGKKLSPDIVSMQEPAGIFLDEVQGDPGTAFDTPSDVNVSSPPTQRGRSSASEKSGNPGQIGIEVVFSVQLAVSLGWRCPRASPVQNDRLDGRPVDDGKGAGKAHAHGTDGVFGGADTCIRQNDQKTSCSASRPAHGPRGR